MNKDYLNLNVIGSDETGVGDYLSPLVATACFVPRQNVKKLMDIGIRDSKSLSDKKIVELFEKIKGMVVYRVKHLTQIGYNKLNSSFNANELKMFLHMSAINELEKLIDDVDLILIDQFSSEKSIEKYKDKLIKSSFGFKDFKARTIYKEKGEKEHVAVAAASIIARAHLLKLMDKQNEEWKTHFPLGTNKVVEEFVINFVKKNGFESLKKVAKISFKTTKKLFEKK